jgi:hypothetical protein
MSGRPDAKSVHTDLDVRADLRVGDTLLVCTILYISVHCFCSIVLVTLNTTFYSLALFSPFLNSSSNTIPLTPPLQSLVQT